MRRKSRHNWFKELTTIVLSMCMAFTMIPFMADAIDGSGHVNAATESVSDVRTVAPSKDNDWYYSSKNAYDGIINSATGGNCTWYAYGRASEYLGKKSGLPMGDACTWYNNWKGSKGSKPKVGSIICWRYKGSNTDGHVAFVEKVDDEGNIFISNSGWSAIPSWNQGGKFKSTRSGNISSGWVKKGSNNWCWFSSMEFQGFIYLDALSIKVANNASTGKPIVTWSKYPGATKYVVYSRTVSGEWEKKLTTTGTTFKNTSAKPTWGYYYKVKAYNGTKLLKTSKEVYRNCKIAKPEFYSISKDSKNRVVLKFRGSKSANCYKIYRSTSATGTYKLLYSLNVKTDTKDGVEHLFYTSSGTKGTKYYYKIQAVHTKWPGADSAKTGYRYIVR